MLNPIEKKQVTYVNLIRCIRMFEQEPKDKHMIPQFVASAEQLKQELGDNVPTNITEKQRGIQVFVSYYVKNKRVEW